MVDQCLRCEDFVSYYARVTPDATAVFYKNRSYSYQQLAEAIDQCASGLLTAGIQKGDRVATLAPPSDTYLITFLAATSVGAIWQGLNPRYQVAELSYLFEDSSPKLLFVEKVIGDRDFSEAVAEVTAGKADDVTVVELEDNLLSHYSEVNTEALAERRSELNESDPAIIVYTSGSTGRPKGALLSHQAIARMSKMQNSVWPADPLVTLNFLPINHVGSIVDTTMPILSAGGKMVLMDQFDPDLSLQLMEEHQVTIWGSIPSVLQMQIASKQFEKTDFSSIQLIVWEGAAISPDIFDILREICPRMATNYGMTETTSAVTITEPTSDRDILLNTVGLPAEGVEIRIADESDNIVKSGEAGEIQTRSIYNTLGYWQRDSETAEAFTHDGYFRTGDLGKLRSDGRLQLVGRKKEMYKSGGYNVYPREIEDTLESHPAVAVAAVVGVEHKLWGESGVAFILPSTKLDESELKEFVKDRLANYKAPKAYVFVDDFPLLPIGKIDKRALQERALALIESE